MARGKIRAALAALAITAALSTPAMAQDKQDQNVSDLGVSPPWQGGRNNDAVDRGFGFTVADADNLADFHGDPANSDLVIYVGGNVYYAFAPLVAAFEAKYPEYKGHLYWVTIPPGLLVRAMKAGGRFTVGNMTWTAKPDVFMAGAKSVDKQITDGLVSTPAVPYMTNTLAIMVPKGNPAGIKGLSDLGRADVKLAMPNPEFEGIARQIQISLAKAGGDALATTVYKTKVADGSTQLTHIHHRQTPLWLMQGKAQAGVTWQSEIEFQKHAGNPIDGIDIPTAQNTTAVYAGAVVKGAAHPEAARRWLDFIRSPDGLAIFERYGFKPYSASAK